MFAQSNSHPAPRQAAILTASLALHGLLLVWLLLPSEPQLVNPVSIEHGENGRVVSRLYFPNRSPDDSDSASADSATEKYHRQRLGQTKLTWKKNNAPRPSNIPLSPTESEDQSKSQTLSSQGHGALAGSPYGTLISGSATGDEIRPALPVQTVDPVAYPWELPNMEGNVVVEITIDERGEIVQKSVLQSMGSKLDERALAALNGWHFHPATRNGVAIASKQDAVFHFRGRA